MSFDDILNILLYYVSPSDICSLAKTNSDIKKSVSYFFGSLATPLCYCVSYQGAINVVVQKDDMYIVEWLLRWKNEKVANLFRNTAAFTGKIAILEWLYNHPEFSKLCHWNDSNFLSRIAYNGCIEAFVWCRNHGCSWDSCSMAAAAIGGHIEIIRWAHENGCPWDRWTTCAAAKKGNLNILQWIYEHGCPIDEITCRVAAKEGHIEVLRWAHEHKIPWDVYTCSEAARGGYIGVLQWLRQNGCPWDSTTQRNAAHIGNLTILEWAHENGCPWSESTCYCAAEEGHLEILQWAHKHGCPWDERTCEYAARGGHFELLRWAHENGCPWNEHTCTEAAGGGHLEMLRWAREQGCPWNKNTCIAVAVGRRRHIDIIHWIRQHDTNTLITNTNMNESARTACLSVDINNFDKIASHSTHIHPMIPRDTDYAKSYMSIERKYQNASDEDFKKITDEELNILINGEDPQDRWRSSWSRKIYYLHEERKNASFKDNDTQNIKNDSKSRSTTHKHFCILQ